MIESLIGRLESGEAPSRELDAEIALAVGKPDWQIETARQMVADGRGDQYLPTGDDRRLRADCVASTRIYPNYTTSLDAALTTMPEGWWLKSVGECRTDIKYAGDRHDPVSWYAALQHINGGRLTSAFSYAGPAVALLIAALKARVAS